MRASITGRIRALEQGNDRDARTRDAAWALLLQRPWKARPPTEDELSILRRCAATPCPPPLARVDLWAAETLATFEEQPQ